MSRERNLSRFACKSHRGNRKYPGREKIDDRVNIRPCFFRDTDRIIHSDAYVRYIDKTQAFYLFENDDITHRTLHVQFVSKISRVIGRALRLNEDLLEAIALGHDLGHSPYGHDGEGYLNEICMEHKIGTFCHNAQSVKYLSGLERKGQGLNLTLQVLDGILSHNGEMLSKKYQPVFGKTWKDHESEFMGCYSTPGFSKNIVPMTLEGCVVRIADVIAYVGRDVEDAIKLNIIKRSRIPKPIVSVLGNKNDDIINKLVTDLIVNSYDKNHLLFSPDVFKALSDLKDFSYDNIYFIPAIKTENHKIRNMFRMLFDQYCDDIRKENRASKINTLFINHQPGEFVKWNGVERTAVDFIAGMTDDYFNNQFKSLCVPRGFGYRLSKKAE